MGINPGDIISTLQFLGMIKYWKGQHVILKKEDLIAEYLEKSRSRPKHRQVSSYQGGWTLRQMWDFPLYSNSIKMDITGAICFKRSTNLSFSLTKIYPGGLKWKPYEPTARERRQAAQIQKNQDDRQQKKR